MKAEKELREYQNAHNGRNPPKRKKKTEEETKASKFRKSQRQKRALARTSPRSRRQSIARTR